MEISLAEPLRLKEGEGRFASFALYPLGSRMKDLLTSQLNLPSWTNICEDEEIMVGSP
jgi:hypothetical protein